MSKKSTYILIHGAWHGSWCWAPIINLLSSAGHTVIAPDLPGHGENCLPPHFVTFDLYVHSIINLIKQQSTPVKLVGHSMGGLVISQVAEKIPDRVEELIYVTGYIPKHHESLISISNHFKSRGVSPHLVVDKVNKEIKLTISEELISVFYHLCDEKHQRMAIERLQPQPLEPFSAFMSLNNGHIHQIKKKAIICTEDRALLKEDQLQMSQSQNIENTLLLSSDHSPFFSAPTDLVKLLLSH